jgi:GTPase
MFRDETEIEVEAGDGGDGAVSFRREKFVPRGGPDGGDGGHGGSVILVAARGVTSLLTIGRSPRYAAPGGNRGGGGDRTGRSGNDLVLEVPIGTIVHDAEHGNRLADLAQEGDRLVVAQGGKGGKGNARFANSVRQVPRIFTPGVPGERRRLRLELKLFADAGLVGMPNAGKSTFLSAVTAARPKIADYPFTTLEPQVGIAALGDTETLVLADLPGLIEGAAAGQGLGHRFLRHVERCRVLLHLVDCSGSAETTPVDAWRVIGDELESFSVTLARKPRLLVATKVESEEGEAAAAELERQSGERVWRISSATRSGVPQLLRAALEIVRAEPAAP